jgi:DNA-binding NarL/FixJ family response regulator
VTRDWPIRVLIADDDPAVVDALAALITADGELELAATAADASEAVERAAREQPDLALIDVRMPAGGGTEAARGIAVHSPQTTIIAFSASGALPATLKPLVTGCIVKGTRVKDVIDLLKRAADDRTDAGREPDGRDP